MLSNYKADIPVEADFSDTSDLFLFLLTLLLLSLEPPSATVTSTIGIALPTGNEPKYTKAGRNKNNRAETTVTSAESKKNKKNRREKEKEGGSTGIWSSITSSSSSFNSISGSGVELLLKNNVIYVSLNTPRNTMGTS
jgi:hypothetical protein